MVNGPRGGEGRGVGGGGEERGTPRVCRGRDSTGAMRRTPPLIPLSGFVLLLYPRRTVGTLRVDFVAFVLYQPP